MDKIIQGSVVVGFAGLLLALAFFMAKAVIGHLMTNWLIQKLRGRRCIVCGRTVAETEALKAKRGPMYRPCPHVWD